MMNLLNFPFELVENIFMCMDDKTLLEMRKVSRFMKELAEATIINRTLSPSIDRLKMVGKIDDIVTTEFIFDKVERIDRFQSKLYFISAVSYLHISKFSYTTESMVMEMTSSETDEIFKKLDPLSRKMQCEALEFYPSTKEILEFTSKFFAGGKTVRELILQLDLSEKSKRFTLALARHLKSGRVRLFLDASLVHTDRFLVHLAEVVDDITVCAPTNGYETYDSHMTFSHLRHFAYHLFTRKCSHLDLADGFLEVPLDEAFNLSEDLAGLQGKKFFFVAPTSEVNGGNYLDVFGTSIYVAEDPCTVGRNLVIITNFS